MTQAMSTALPWMPVPAHLRCHELMTWNADIDTLFTCRNDPTSPSLVGDLGFDPLGPGIPVLKLC